ncbi:glycosyltransferase family 2 protein [Limosilactobacillus sp.]|uniref:glycosyltransferase family 2 protein n=1 Tax=Limosilactobacillus sp. TaxID=2773925 RepID=UPI00345EC3EF
MSIHKIAAIVVTYKRKPLLKECINSLLKQTYKDLDILIIDNHSLDGTDQLVHSFKDDRVLYQDTGQNLGGAGGFQYGIREGVERGYDYLWLMDDDSIPEPKALSNLVKTHKQLPNNGFLSSKVLWKDGSMCQMNIPKVSLNRKLTDFEGHAKRIIMTSFVSFFVSAQVVRKVGLPIKEFFIWADDFEYSRRISRQYPCYFVPSSIVVHKCKSNTGSNIVNDSVDRLPRYRYAYRNEVYVYRREGFAGWIHLALKTILHLTRCQLKAKDHKAERRQIILQATLKGFSFHPKIEYVKTKD